eukprot:1159304-Pelagomonas_calceolata.AAC.4
MSHHSLARVDLAAVAGSLWQPSLASCQAAKEASLHQQRDRIGCNSCLKPEPKVPPQLSSPTSYADEIPDMLASEHFKCAGASNRVARQQQAKDYSQMGFNERMRTHG